MNFISLDHQVHAIEDYDLLQIIDQTNYSTVYKGLDKKTGRIVAIKAINMVVFNILNKNQNDLALALKTYKIRPFKNICQVFVCFGQEGKLYIVMEYFAGGSLQDLLQLCVLKHRSLSVDELSVILKELLIGVQEIHQEGLVHRHIKAANIFLSSEGKIKLSYFSTNKEFSDTLNKSQSQMLSLPYWLAPETISQSICDQQSDVWAIGITAYHLVTGKIPYEDLAPQKAIFRIVQGPPPQLTGQYSPELIDFVNSCLTKNRPTVNQLLQHPILKQTKKQLIFDLFEMSARLKTNQDHQDSSQEQIYTHNRVITSYKLDQSGLDQDSKVLKIKRTIFKIEKYKPGLSKIVFLMYIRFFKKFYKRTTRILILIFYYEIYKSKSREQLIYVIIVQLILPHSPRRIL